MSYFTLPKSKTSRANFASSILLAVLIIALQSALAGVFFGQINLQGDVEPSDKEIQTPGWCPTLSGDLNSSLPGSSGGEDNSNNAGSILVYLIIFILAHFFQVFLVYDALRAFNFIQVLAHTVFLACCFAYSIIQYTQIKDLLDPCTVAAHVVFKETSNLDFSEAAIACNAGCQLFNRLAPFIAVSIALHAVFVILFGILSWPLWSEYQWRMYENLFAHDQITLAKQFHIFFLLLKLEVFFVVAFAIQFLYLVLHSTDPEYAITIVIILVAIPIATIAYYGVATENRYIMIAWVTFLLAICAYFIFKIARIYSPSQAAKYVGSGRFLTLFAALGLLVTVLLLLASLQCWKNFGRGLKDGLKPFSFSSWAKADEFGEGKSSSPNPISNNRKSVYDDKVDVGLNDETL